MFIFVKSNRDKVYMINTAHIVTVSSIDNQGWEGFYKIMMSIGPDIIIDSEQYNLLCDSLSIC